MRQINDNVPSFIRKNMHKVFTLVKRTTMCGLRTFPAHFITRDKVYYTIIKLLEVKKKRSSQIVHNSKNVITTQLSIT